MPPARSRRGRRAARRESTKLDQDRTRVRPSTSRSRFDVTTEKIDMVEKVATGVGELICAGIDVSAEPLEYISTDLAQGEARRAEAATEEARRPRATSSSTGSAASSAGCGRLARRLPDHPARLDRRQRLRDQRHVHPREGRHRGRHARLRRRRANGATINSMTMDDARPADRHGRRRLPDPRADSAAAGPASSTAPSTFGSGRTAALKLLTPELGEDDFRERFLRESKLAASIDHPSIVPVYDAGEEDGAALHRDGLRRRAAT